MQYDLVPSFRQVLRGDLSFGSSRISEAKKKKNLQKSMKSIFIPLWEKDIQINNLKPLINMTFMPGVSVEM